MPAAAEAPPATPASIPESVGSSKPPSGGTINVSDLPKGDPTVAPAKPGSAKEKMFAELQKKAGVDPSPNSAQRKPSSGRPSAAEVPEVPASGEDPDPIQQDPPPPSPGDPEPTPRVDEKGKKVSPWKLVDQFKARAAAAEARALELEKQIIPEDKRKESETRLTEYEKRMAEAENELRYHNAEKWDPDIKKLNADYTNAWKRAVSELSEISLTDPETQQQRPATAQDLLQLVNLPLGQARAIADQVFGPFADDVMAHRKEIKGVFEQKSAKLEELKTTATDREKQRTEAWQKQNAEVNTQVQTSWEAAVKESLADEKHSMYFKPKEGDDDWNAKLEHGFKLVDDAHSTNALDPKLTPEDRAKIIRRHVAVRNRAAAFGPLRLAYEKLQKEYTAQQKELAQYKGSTPSPGGRLPSASTASNGSAKDRMFADLAKLAKPQ